MLAVMYCHYLVKADDFPASKPVQFTVTSESSFYFSKLLQTNMVFPRSKYCLKFGRVYETGQNITHKSNAAITRPYVCQRIPTYGNMLSKLRAHFVNVKRTP